MSPMAAVAVMAHLVEEQRAQPDDRALALLRADVPKRVLDGYTEYTGRSDLWPLQTAAATRPHRQWRQCACVRARACAYLRLRVCA